MATARPGVLEWACGKASKVEGKRRVPMRTLMLSSLLAACLIGTPQAIAQTPASPPGGGEFLPPPGATPPSRGPVSPSTTLPPAGGGQELPAPGLAPPARGPVSPSTQLPPAGGGQDLPPPTRR